jgi:hypothetical protein
MTYGAWQRKPRLSRHGGTKAATNHLGMFNVNRRNPQAFSGLASPGLLEILGEPTGPLRQFLSFAAFDAKQSTPTDALRRDPRFDPN